MFLVVFSVFWTAWNFKIQIKLSAFMLWKIHFNAAVNKNYTFTWAKTNNYFHKYVFYLVILVKMKICLCPLIVGLRDILEIEYVLSIIFQWWTLDILSSYTCSGWYLTREIDLRFLKLIKKFIISIFKFSLVVISFDIYRDFDKHRPLY